MTYSNKKLKELADLELIWPKNGPYYRKLLKQNIKDIGWDMTKFEEAEEEVKMNLVHMELWLDVCELVNDLAQLVLDEREERAKALYELKTELKKSINDIIP